MIEQKTFTPSDIFDKSSGCWIEEVNGVMIQRVYKDGKLVSEEPVQLATGNQANG